MTGRLRPACVSLVFCGMLSALVALPGGLPGGGSAHAQDRAGSRALARDWQKRYVAIVGAWFLDRRCRFLGTADRRELEWLSAQLTLGHAGRVGLRTVRRQQDIAIKLIGQGDYVGCGTNNRRIVREALPWARADVRAVTGQTYDPWISYRDFALGRFAVSLAHTRLDSRCNHVAAAEKGQLAGLRRAVVTGLAETYGSAQVDRAVERATTLAASDTSPCGPATESRLRAAIADLRELRREFAP